MSDMCLFKFSLPFPVLTFEIRPFDFLKRKPKKPSVAASQSVFGSSIHEQPSGDSSELNTEKDQKKIRERSQSFKKRLII